MYRIVLKHCTQAAPAPATTLSWPLPPVVVEAGVMPEVVLVLVDFFAAAAAAAADSENGTGAGPSDVDAPYRLSGTEHEFTGS